MKSRRFGIDERFMAHRLLSSSAGGIAGGVLAIWLLVYRYFSEKSISWDLLAVGMTMILVKLGVLLWYRLND